MSVLVVGSIAIDSVETPYGKRKKVLGGSAVYFSVSASFFTTVYPVGVVGTDFPRTYISLLGQRGIDVNGIEIARGKTFRWAGKYGYDLNQAQTISTALNCFRDFSPKLRPEHRRLPYVFLANIDPNLQLMVLKKVAAPRFVACDSMNYWIQHERKALARLLKRVDVFILNDAEARLFSGESNLIKAAKYIFSLGPERVIIKRGDGGSLFVTSGQGCFIAPAYLMEEIKDPTGAGDSFAGGFMGFVSKTGDLSERGLRKAVIYGTVMASFCVQDFGPDNLLKIKPRDVTRRLGDYRRITCF